MTVKNFKNVLLYHRNVFEGMKTARQYLPIMHHPQISGASLNKNAALI